MKKNISSSKKHSEPRHIKQSLTVALSKLREKNYSFSKQRHCQTAREMVFLGKLANSWSDIAGPDLALNTFPFRILKDKLFLAVADSQWMFTLTFLKQELITKINTKIDGITVKKIIAQPGKIPLELKKIVNQSLWPNWESESSPDLNLKVDSELSQIISRCSKKQKARIKGLYQKGFKICDACKANFTDLKSNRCAICEHENKRDLIIKAEKILKDMPWLSINEINEIEPGLSSGELCAIKSQLFENTACLVDEAFEFYFGLAETDIKEKQNLQLIIKKLITEAIMLSKNCLPYEIDLLNPSKEHIVDKKWFNYLSQMEFEC